MSNAHDDHTTQHVEWMELARIAFVSPAIVATWLRLWQPLPHFDGLGFATVLIGGYAIFRKTFADLLSRRMTIAHPHPYGVFTKGNDEGTPAQTRSASRKRSGLSSMELATLKIARVRSDPESQRQDDDGRKSRVLANIRNAY